MRKKKGYMAKKNKFPKQLELFPKLPKFFPNDLADGGGTAYDPKDDREVDGFLKNKSRIGAKPYFFKIDNLESVDIDEEFDFILARSIMKKRISDSLNGKK